MPAPALAPAALPALLRELWRLLAAHRPAVRQRRVFDRLRALVLGQLCAGARHSLTHLLLTLGLVATDPRAFYRLVGQARLDGDTLARCYLHETLADVPVEEPYVAVVEGLQIARNSRTRPGTAWLQNPRPPPWKPGSQRAQVCVHLAALLPRWQGYSRALPLRLDAAFPPKAVPGAAPPQPEGQAALAQLQWLRAELDAAGRGTHELLVLGAGHYDTVALWTHLPQRTILLARTAGNRVLWALPPAGARRTRRYGARAPRPEAWLRERRGWSQATVRVRGRDVPLRYRVAGP